VQCQREDFKMMPNEYSHLPPSCPHRHVLYESLATGISTKTTIPDLQHQLHHQGAETTAMDHHPIATVGYLSHSWIHFQPEIISSEASFLLQQHLELLPPSSSAAVKLPSSASSNSKFQIRNQEKKKSSSKKKVNTSEKKQSKPADSILPISSLNINDAISSIRNIFRGSNPSHNHQQEQEEGREMRPNESPVSSSEEALGYEELLALEIERENRLKVCMDVVVSPSERKRVAEIPSESSSDSVEEEEAYGIFEWNLPSSVKHLSTYLEQQKEHILYGLMTIVTLRSINHENICCINTSLLIFIYAHKRSLPPFFFSSSPHPFVRNQVPKLLTGVKYLSQTTSNHLNHLSFGSEEYSVLRNFRELLWYWTEYYTRRGRDRLSLEFSTHVPFSKWKEIVGMFSLLFLLHLSSLMTFTDLMCQDDGSPCALLCKPIPLPISPYVDLFENPFRIEKYIPSL
jgi:hypothetical protein